MAPSASSRSMMSITSLRLTIARTAHQPSSSSWLTVGDSKPGVIFSAAASFASRHVVFQQRIAAGDHDAFEPPDDAVAKLALLRGRVLHEQRLVVADLVEDPEPVGRQRAAGFHQVDDRVGHAQRDHHFDRAGELDDVAGDVRAWRDTRCVTFGKLVAMRRPARSAGFWMSLSSGTQNASRQLPTPSASRVTSSAPTSSTRSPPVMPRSIAPSAHRTGMSSVRRNVTSIGMSRTRANRLRSSRRNLSPASMQQLGGHVGQAAFARDADAEVHGGGVGSQESGVRSRIYRRDFRFAFFLTGVHGCHRLSWRAVSSVALADRLFGWLSCARPFLPNQRRRSGGQVRPRRRQAYMFLCAEHHQQVIEQVAHFADEVLAGPPGPARRRLRPPRPLPRRSWRRSSRRRRSSSWLVYDFRVGLLGPGVDGAFELIKWSWHAEAVGTVAFPNRGIARRESRKNWEL